MLKEQPKIDRRTGNRIFDIFRNAHLGERDDAARPQEGRVWTTGLSAGGYLLDYPHGLYESITRASARRLVRRYAAVMIDCGYQVWYRETEESIECVYMHKNPDYFDCDPPPVYRFAWARDT